MLGRPIVGELIGDGSMNDTDFGGGSGLRPGDLGCASFTRSDIMISMASPTITTAKYGATHPLHLFAWIPGCHNSHGLGVCWHPRRVAREVVQGLVGRAEELDSQQPEEGLLEEDRVLVVAGIRCSLAACK